MQKKNASRLYSGIKPICGLATGLALLSSIPVQAYNIGMPAPDSDKQVEQSKESSQASYYLKYKPDMEEQARSLVTKMGGTITDSMPERHILIVTLNKADIENIDSDRANYRHIIEYVEINPQRQLLEKKTSLSY